MSIKSSVQDYYGKTLQTSQDLLTDACCTPGAAPNWLAPVLANIHPDVTRKYYGCGFVAPLALEGAAVLDLGAGSGRDVYALAQLVGPTGRVVGVDMTPEQLAVARDAKAWHAERFGYDNTTFLEGDIEDLGALDLPAESFDVIVSNCVVNLVEDKARVFSDAFRLLKPGGEFYFSDIYADRRLADDLRTDPVARGECLGGALYWNDFLRLARQAGFADPRLVEDRPLAIDNAALRARLAPAQFHSATFRMFRIEGLEDACEDYGQAVIYHGGMANAETTFRLDKHHEIEKARVFPVCGNTFRMLSESRFHPWFEFIGDWSHHYGLFPGCGEAAPFGTATPEAARSGACC